MWRVYWRQRDDDWQVWGEFFTKEDVDENVLILLSKRFQVKVEGREYRFRPRHHRKPERTGDVR
jgi:hypothetical protein